VRSYNIAVLTSSPSLVEYRMPDDPVRALNRLGEHKIIEIDYKDIYRLHGPSKTEVMVSEILHKNKVDIVIFCLGDSYEFSIEYFSELQSDFFTVVDSWEDEHYFDKSSRYYSQAFDLVTTVGQLSAQRYELYGIDAIPYYGGYDTRNWRNLSCEKIYDVCFVGSGYKVGRKNYLNHLIGNNVDVRMFGSGGPGGVISRDEMNEVYCSSKIGLNFTGIASLSGLDRDISVNNRIKQIKARTQEIAMTGTFALCEYSSEIEKLFEIGSEIDVFHNKDELLSKVEYYLKNEAEREAMASKGFERAVRDYDEVNVWKNFMAEFHKRFEVKSKSNNIHAEKIIYKDPIFKRAFSSFHLYKMLGFLLSGKPGNAFAEFVVCMKYPLFDGGVFLYYVKDHVVNFLASIGWLRSLVRKIKKCFE
jgi:spore maturation protein CgeB